MMKTKADFRVREQNQIIAQRIRFERAFNKPIRTALDRQIQPVIEAWERSGDVSMGSVDMVREFPIIDLFLRLYVTVGVPFAKQSFRNFKALYVPNYRMKRDEADDMALTWEDRFRTYALSAGSSKITGITETTREFVRRIIAQAGDEGLSIQNTVKRLRQEWKELSRYRATVISRTEILSASNYAQHIGAQDIARRNNMQLNKIWLSARDRRVRDSHRKANKQTVDINDYFIVNGYQAMHPGSPELPVQEVVFCRCSMYHEPKE